MRVCLFNLPFIVGETYLPLPKNVEPIHLAYLGAHLIAAGHEVKIPDLHLECTHRFGSRSLDRRVRLLTKGQEHRGSSHSPAALLRFMAARIKAHLRDGYDLVGVNGDISQLCMYALRSVKEDLAPPTTVVGGHSASGDHRKYAEQGCVDYVIVGEGEETLAELATALEEGRRVDDVAGLCYRQGDRIAVTAARPPIDLSRALPPARHLLEITVYHRLNGSISVVTSRGCVNQCTFCGRHLYPGQRFVPPARVAEELEDLQRQYNISTFIFYDNTLNGSEEHLQGLCREILARGLRIRWTCLARPEGLAAPVIQLMQQAGCILISIGIESASSRVLAGINKNIDLRRVRRLLRRCRTHGISTRATFMYDLPREQFSDLAASLLFIATAPLDLVTFWPLEHSSMAPLFRRRSGGTASDDAATTIAGGGKDGVPLRQWAAFLAKRRILEALNFYYQRKAEWLSRRIGLDGRQQGVAVRTEDDEKSDSDAE